MLAGTGLPGTLHLCVKIAQLPVILAEQRTSETGTALPSRLGLALVQCIFNFFGQNLVIFVRIVERLVLGRTLMTMDYQEPKKLLVIK
jgi:hypothetical protein